MSVPTVVIRVELPAYSSSFDIQVFEGATVLDVKQAISTVCIGHPRPDGQRVIWRGRSLDEQEKISELWPHQDDQRTVHLSVRPSAWTSDPPSANATMTPSSHAAPYPTLQSPLSESQQHSFATPTTTLHSNGSLAFVHFKHSQALSWLSSSRLAAPSPLEDMDVKRKENDIYPFKPPGVLLLLCSCMLFMFSPIPSLSSLRHQRDRCPLLPRRIQTLQSVPPHVNDLLQELGLPPLRAVPNANVGITVQQDAAGAPANPEQAEGNVIREIPMRALLAPLLMVVFRTVLLLYFFSPTRKPLLGLCLIAWIIYEMWTHVRIVILRPGDRAGENGVGVGVNGAQAGGAADAAPAAAPVGRDNDHAGDRNPQQSPARTPNAEHIRDAQQMQGPPIPRQSNGIVDSLALANVHSENKLLWPLQQSTIVPEPPTFTRKVMTFFSLLLVTLHPEVYNRRRVALRQRESRLRTEMNSIERDVDVRNDEQVPSEEEHRSRASRQQLQAQHAQRPAWVKRYVGRVRQDDWIEE
ncbi:hypothetical protein JVU11DRAFT_1817 [Chiua virens]|nr:hypothetical protein JVU11DRAFT_1817 [Chiua virens]